MVFSDTMEESLVAWEREEVRAHAGFGFYPNTVWTTLENMVQYFLQQGKADELNRDISMYAIDRKDEFKCTVLSEVWPSLFPQLFLLNQSLCSPLWDGASCIPPTIEGETAVFPCMTMYNNQHYSPHSNATRDCLAGGVWAAKTNYSYCTTKEDPIDPPDLEISIIVYFVGYSISLLALFIAVCTFLSFREMRCMRHKIHIGLFLTYIFADLAWIITALLQNLLVAVEGQTVLVVWCAFRNLLSYFHLTTFFWMFLEGVYLFLQVQLPLSLANIKHKHFLLFGWGCPLLVIIVWGILRTTLPITRFQEKQYNTTDEDLAVYDCPFLSEHPIDFLAYKMPVFTLLVCNTFFLVWIMVIVVSKLRAQTVMEYDYKHWKAAKALIVVIPLLGFTYILTLVGPDREENPQGYLVFQFIRAVLLSTQGFVITLPYCFLNSEVRGVVKTRWERWQLIRSVGADNNGSNRTSVNCSTYFTTEPKQNGNGDRCKGGKLLEVPLHHSGVPVSRSGSSHSRDIYPASPSFTNTPSFTNILGAEVRDGVLSV